MRVTLKHDLGKEEVRRRMRERAHEIAGYFPAGMATVETEWPSDDVMALTVTAVGQKIDGAVEVEEDHVVIEMNLPAMLGFLRGTLEHAVRNHGAKLLE